MFANAGPRGEPMATPSICQYMLLKLNSTEEVASCINSTKMSRGKGGFGKTLLLYRASAQICKKSVDWQNSVDGFFPENQMPLTLAGNQTVFVFLRLATVVPLPSCQ